MPEPRALVPSDERTERAVIGGILLEGLPAFFKVQTEQLQPVDFWDRRLQLIYEVCWRLAEGSQEITIPTVAYLLNKDGHLDQAGGEELLFDLTGSTFTAVGIEAHARIVVRDAKMRRMMGAMQQGVAAIGNGHHPDEIPALVEGLLRDALGDRASTRGVSLRDAADRAREQSPRVRTGIGVLDTGTGGFGLGELVVVGAYSSHGKTALSSRIALNQALSNVPVCYIPIEGGAAKLEHRMAAALAGTSLTHVRDFGWDTPEQSGEYDFHLGVVRDLPIWTADPRHMPTTPDALASYITVMARQHGIQCFFVDHLEVMSYPEGRNENTARSYERGIRKLQETAHREQVALVLQSQVTMPRERRPVVPEKSMLRNSAAKEHLSQIILMVGLDVDSEGITQQQQVAEGVIGTPMYVTLAKFSEGGMKKLSRPGDIRLYIDSRSGAVEEVG